MAPIKKLTIQDTDQSFEEGVIISAKLGKPVSFEELLADLNNCRIVYIGEKHTNVAHHRIQLEVIQAIFKNQPNLAVGMEMFDHTYQDVLDIWSAGELDQRDFLKKSHWYANWRFDFSLYREILEFIQENHLRLVALNIPSHIPPKIREGGIDNLRPDEKKHLPQQIDTSRTAHRDYLQNVFDGHKHHFRGEVEFEDFYAAQSVWEDAMAEMISQHLKDDVMVVLAGNGHIQFKYGIPDRAFSRTAEAFRTIYLAPVGEVVELDIADYIWVTP
ncbi:MAG: ChaN family lipoprotein [Desulfobacterales bacterium]